MNEQKPMTRELLAPVTASMAPPGTPMTSAIVIGVDRASTPDQTSWSLTLRHADGTMTTTWLSEWALDRLTHILAAAVQGNINAPIGGIGRVA